MAHPLALIRAAEGLSPSEYARIVARTHAELGFGQMAARREKVHRWESGRTVPEPTAQLAMAHHHGVPAPEVHRLGWPHWLHLVIGDAVLLDQPYTAAGAALALNSALHLPKAPCPAALLLTGAALAAHLRTALVRATTDADRNPDGTGPRDTSPHDTSPHDTGPPDTGPHDTGPSAEQLRWIGARTSALERHESGTYLPTAALYGAAHAEHRLVVRLIGAHGHDGPAARRLFRFAARTALVCAWLSSALGEETRAERHNLTAVRAAAAAGEPDLAAVATARLAARHVVGGDPVDALALVRAARTVGTRPSPGTMTALHCTEALALARLGHAAGSARALDRAGKAASATPAAGDTPFGAAPFGAAPFGAAPFGAAPFGAAPHRLTVTVARARSALLLGAPHEAEPHFRVLVDSLQAPPAGAPSPHTGSWLLDAVDAHLAVGDFGSAAVAVHRAVHVTGTLPPGLARQYRDRLSAHGREPAVRRALEFLRDTAPHESSMTKSEVETGRDDAGAQPIESADGDDE
ncbi:hypothetical protein ACFV4G_22940 [Kitasatospora sp. NPDC059747]|uniref:hypothetical protein n=1 Tax=Kitasatospora sp. NPDC059747 TaxID=3346930 RepID=UPI00364C0961